jgi:hypothetical protein
MFKEQEVVLDSEMVCLDGNGCPCSINASTVGRLSNLITLPAF